MTAEGNADVVEAADSGPPREQPLLAVDVVPVAFAAGELWVATARRQFDPFAGRQALPGVLLGAGEAVRDAALRALADKAGIAAVRHLFQIGAFDGSNRDPRSHAISLAFVGVVAPEAVHAPVGEADDDAAADTDDANPYGTAWRRAGVPGLPFDHDAIVAEALAQIRNRLWRDDALTRALTGPWFSTPDAVRLGDAVTGGPTHQSNLRRSLAANPRLRSTPAPDTGRPGRRPLVWEWTDAEG